MQRVNDRLFSWASLIEADTLAQAEKAARLPFVFPHIALMPDAHLGKGATVGSVIPTLNAIVPAAVGVDIGCGMAAVRTRYHRDELSGDLSKLRIAIERAIPLSAGVYNTAVTPSAAVRLERLTAEAEKAGFDPSGTPETGSCSSARSAAATTSSRSARTRPGRCGCSCTPARAASATRSPPATSRSRRRR